MVSAIAQDHRPGPLSVTHSAQQEGLGEVSAAPRPRGMGEVSEHKDLRGAGQMSPASLPRSSGSSHHVFTHILHICSVASAALHAHPPWGPWGPPPLRSPRAWGQMREDWDRTLATALGAPHSWRTASDQTGHTSHTSSFPAACRGGGGFHAQHRGPSRTRPGPRILPDHTTQPPSPPHPHSSCPFPPRPPRLLDPLGEGPWLPEQSRHGVLCSATAPGLCLQELLPSRTPGPA